MSRSIEFTTSGPYTKFTNGNPVHDGRIPQSEPENICIDGEPITFTDESLPEKLYRTLILTERLQRKSAIIDCLAFVALMQGQELPSGKFSLHPKVEPRHTSPHDKENTLPLALGHSFHGQTNYTHAVFPAHQPESALYIHKMGDTEPVCLSSLIAVKKMYDTVVAHPITELGVSKAPKRHWWRS